VGCLFARLNSPVLWLTCDFTIEMNLENFLEGRCGSFSRRRGARGKTVGCHCARLSLIVK